MTSLPKITPERTSSKATATPLKSPSSAAGNSSLPAVKGAVGSNVHVKPNQAFMLTKGGIQAPDINSNERLLLEYYKLARKEILKTMRDLRLKGKSDDEIKQYEKNEHNRDEKRHKDSQEAIRRAINYGTWHIKKKQLAKRKKNPYEIRYERFERLRQDGSPEEADAATGGVMSSPTMNATITSPILPPTTTSTGLRVHPGAPASTSAAASSSSSSSSSVSGTTNASATLQERKGVVEITLECVNLPTPSAQWMDLSDLAAAESSMDSESYVFALQEHRGPAAAACHSPFFAHVLAVPEGTPPRPPTPQDSDTGGLEEAGGLGSSEATHHQTKPSALPSPAVDIPVTPRGDDIESPIVGLASPSSTRAQQQQQQQKPSILVSERGMQVKFDLAVPSQVLRVSLCTGDRGAITDVLGSADIDITHVARSLLTQYALLSPSQHANPEMADELRFEVLALALRNRGDTEYDRRMRQAKTVWNAKFRMLRRY